MTKVVLNNIESGFATNTTLNDNFNLITDAIENTLSRDGTSPNEMEAALDMNSNRILNLPDAITASEPVTLRQVLALGGSIVLSTNDASLIDYHPEGADAVTRSVESKLRESASVKDFGAVGDGIVDDTPFFSLAAKEVHAAMNINGNRGSGISHANSAIVVVPAGSWNITDWVDVGNREITWDCDPAAVFVGSGEDFLNGKVLRRGDRISTQHHYNTVDYACGFSVAVNQRQGFGDYSPGVLGITSPAQLATNKASDSVGMYVENSSPLAIVDSASATYTATTAVIPAPSATALKKYRKGMVLQTKHATPWSAILDSWSADGSTLTVQIGWYLQGGGGVASTPTNDGTGVRVNVFKKCWAHNANVHLRTAADAPTVKSCTGFELGTLNLRADSTALFLTEENRCWGFDSINLGTFKGFAGYMSRGNTTQWLYNYYAVNGSVGYMYQGTGNPFRAVQPTTEEVYFQMNGQGSMEIGRQATATAVNTDYHTSGFSANDYDVRMQVTGGTDSSAGGHNGEGNVVFNANLLSTTGELRATGLTTEDKRVSIGAGRTGDGNSYLDFVGDATYPTYGLRILRSAGPNGSTVMTHRGNGGWVFNCQDGAGVSFTGGQTFLMTAATTEDQKLGIGTNRSGDGNSYVDLVGDATYTAYGTRLIRSAGANGATSVLHRGTGALVLHTTEAANIVFQPAATTSVTMKSNGAVNFVPIAEPLAGSNGDVYYDVGTDKLRCYAAGSWHDLF